MVKRKILNPKSKSNIDIFIDKYGNKRWKFKSSSYKAIEEYDYGKRKKK